MGFTGRLGTGNSRLGNVLLGAIDTLGDGTFGFQVHQVESDKVRVKFDTRVRLPSATQISRYNLGIVSGTSTLPTIVSIQKYDNKEDSVVLNLNQNLTTGAIYSLELGEIFNVFGDTVSFVSTNFVANVIVPPLARGAFLSKRSTVDIIFDKNVGMFSSGASFAIRDASGGPTTAMTQLTWATEGIANNILRVSLPGGMPSADAYVIEYTDVTDISENSGSDEVPLTLELRSSTPHSFASISQLQITDAFVTDVSNDAINTSTVRVYFNGPLDDTGTDTLNWSVAVQAPHNHTDTVNLVSSPDASDLSSSLVLANELKSVYNLHRFNSGGSYHSVADGTNIVSSVDAVDQTTLNTLLNEIKADFNLHISNSGGLFHTIVDSINTITSSDAIDLNSSLTLIDEIKTKYNDHISDLTFHPIADISNGSSSSTAQDTVNTLVNELKTDFNSHLVEEQVHFRDGSIDEVTEDDATDLPTSIVLILDIQDKLLSHLGRFRIHYYADEVNSFDATTPVDLATSISLANSLKDSFNSHLAVSYPLTFSTAYPSPIDEITSWARYDTQRAFETIGPYTCFVDLHIILTSSFSVLLITADVTSEDGGSSTSSGDFTGSITSRSLNDKNEFLSTLVNTDRGVDLHSDKELYLLRSPKLLLINGDDRPIHIEQQVFTTLRALTWVLNQVVYAYSNHIDSSNGAVHLNNDGINTIGASDYVTVATLSEMILKANSFKNKLNLHISTSNYHVNPDSDLVTSQPASDLRTASKLVKDIRDTYVRHNSRLGVHDSSGSRVVSAKLDDLLCIDTDFLQHGEIHTLSGTVRGFYFDNLDDEARYNDNFINETFTGSANRPSLASVVPKLGILKEDDGRLSMFSDSVEFYFSKEMREVTLDSSNLVVSGGSINPKLGLWINNQIANLEVIKMDEITYTATAIGLVDEAGNSIY